MTINNQNSVFNSFPRYSNVPARDAANLSTQNNNIKPKNEEGDTVTISSVKVSDAAKNKKHKILLWTVASSIAVAGGAALLLTKGFSASSYNRINKLINSINEKISARTAKGAGKKAGSFFRNFNIALAKGAKKTLAVLKSASNFSAVKDSTSDLILKSNPVTRKVADTITGWFQKISFKSVADKYGLAGKGARDLRSLNSQFIESLKKSNTDLSQVIKFKDGTSKTLQECMDILNVNSNGVVKEMDKNFDILKLEQRKKIALDYLAGVEDYGGNKIDGGLNKKVRRVLYKENGGILKPRENANVFKSYVTEDIIAPVKDTLVEELSVPRKMITNGVKHNTADMRAAMQDILVQTKIDDDETAKILNKITNEIKLYSTIDGKKEVILRREIAERTDDLLRELNEKVHSNGYSSQSCSIVQDKTEIIKNVMRAEKGSLQKINTIISVLSDEKVAILSKKDAKEIRAVSDRVSDLLTDAVEKESGEMLDKFAELQVGSGPNDVLGLATPLAVGAYAISKAKDKDERTTVALTTGIPIVGSLGVIFWGAAKSISGPKNLLMALGTGLGLNVIGKLIDKIVKAYQEKKSFTQVAVDAYKNSIIPQ